MEKPTIIFETKDGFEKNPFYRRALYTGLIQPILNRLPAHSQSRIKKSHKMAKDVIENRTSHRALEVLYTGGYQQASTSFKKKVSRAVWMNTDNVIGVRNRLLLVEREITNHLQNLATQNSKKEIRLLSIASGSARSFVDVLSRITLPHGTSLSVTFLDKNPLALEYSRGLVAAASFDSSQYSFYWEEGTANAYLNGLGASVEFDLIEMVGLMDYFDNEKAIATMSAIREHLCSNGCMLTANILPNKEQRFISDVVDWHMIYRTPDSFAALAEKAGFSREKITGYVEPMRVHVLLRACK
jgi:hypothetical protein